MPQSRRAPPLERSRSVRSLRSALVLAFCFVLGLCSFSALADDPNPLRKEASFERLLREELQENAPAEKQRVDPPEHSVEPDEERVKGTRRIRAVRVKTGPTIDGRLKDEAWKSAPASGRLVQASPQEGAAPTERTEFRIVYDDTHVYFAVWCFDSEPDKIVARKMSRDASPYSDDFVMLVLDTFRDRRNGYMFTVTPAGSRYDVLISDNTNRNESWDTIWRAKTSIDDEGWKAEIAIPLSSISFDPDAPAWGFNIARRIRRKSETCRWTGARFHLRVYNVSEAGELIGLEGLTQGLGLDVTPYIVGRHRDERLIDDSDTLFDVGGDVRYRISPNLTASFSYNTDFAQTEIDSRQVNLTRFPLFFPEKRDFFLEDTGIFRFGGLNDSFIPFFSRRVGLRDNGSIVPIMAAAKLTGRIDKFNVGALNALVDSGDGVGERNVFASRISRNVFEQGSLGMIMTAGDPNTLDDNLLLGGDFNYRNTDLFDDSVLTGNLFAMGSFTEGQPGDDNGSFGAEFDLRGDKYVACAEVKQIDEDFDAALGFVPRKGVRIYDTELEYRPRPESVESVQQLFFMYESQHVTDLSNRLETAEHRLFPLFVRFESRDEIFYRTNAEFDAPDEIFEISDGVNISPGEYWWTSHMVGFETASLRPVEVEMFYRFGDFYDGQRQGWSVEAEARPSRHLLLGLEYTLNNVQLPAGDFDTRVASARMRVNFTADFSWFHLVQYDSVSESIGYNSRIQWEFRPGALLFLVFNQSIDRNAGRLEVIQNEIATKLGVTFRF